MYLKNNSIRTKIKCGHCGKKYFLKSNHISLYSIFDGAYFSSAFLRFLSTKGLNNIDSLESKASRRRRNKKGGDHHE